MNRSADAVTSSRPYKEHTFLAVQILLWFVLAQSESLPDWLDYVCLAAVAAFLTRMHFLIRQLRKQPAG